MIPRWLTKAFNAILALLAVVAIGTALWALHRTAHGLSIEHLSVGETPVTVFRPAGGGRAPVVLIAHGFAGSQQLMLPFATTFARNGYIAVTFDFPGHGRNPRPLTGSITQAHGATRRLEEETERIAAFARPLGDGRLAVLGHSMASDIVVRFAQAHPDVSATVAVSMFSPVVTKSAPRNLLVIAGGWEGMLKQEALRAVGLAVPGGSADERVTYGQFADGSARRAAFSPGVEHIGVLYSPASMVEALHWIDAAFGVARQGAPYIDARGFWILLLLAGVVALGRPLSGLLPVVSAVPLGANLGWRRLLLPLLLPMVATPLLLRVVPTHFLPVLVGDYLAAHFALYGVLTAAVYAFQGEHVPAAMKLAPVNRTALIAAVVVVGIYGLAGVGWPIDAYVTSFFPVPARVPLVAAMLVGTLAFFLSDEWVTRGQNAARGGYTATKVAFLVSLSLAVALDFGRLFFLVIIVPVIVLFFIVYGLFSGWVYRKTRHPLVAGIANAIVFAWAIGVSFPLLSG